MTSPTLIGLGMFALMLVLMVIRVPIAASMFIPGAIGYWAINNQMALFNLLKGLSLIHI